MALRSAPGLLKAIQGFQGETAGSKQHEGINGLLARVAEEVSKGKATPRDTPGRRAAQNASQREMPAEVNHDGGDGQKTANRQGSAHDEEPAGDIHNTTGKLSGAAPPSSKGNTIANAHMPFPSSPGEIRRLAAARESSRPDSKIRKLEGKGDGNERSVKPGPPEPPAAQVGNAPTPTRPGSAPDARQAAASAQTQPEARPPFAQQQLKGDGWQEAKAKARGRLK